MNGFQEEKLEDVELPSVEHNTESVDAQEPTDEAPDTENDKQPSSDDQSKEETQPPSVENTLLESPQQQPSGGGEHQEPSTEVPQAAVVYSEEQEPAAETEAVSRKMEVPNNKVNNILHNDQLGFFWCCIGHCAFGLVATSCFCCVNEPFFRLISSPFTSPQHKE